VSRPLQAAPEQPAAPAKRSVKPSQPDGKMAKEAIGEQDVEYSVRNTKLRIEMHWWLKNRTQESENVHGLAEEHRQYLMQRHGTLDLDPVPDMSDSDPYNWPKSKVSDHINLEEL
jgi:hypothetical protein